MTSADKVKIGSKYVGKDSPCFIIAEVGVNHNGDIRLAKKLIGEARSVGADAIKFQAFRTEDVVTKKAEKAKYQRGTNGKEESQYDMIKKLELSRGDFKELAGYAYGENIIFLSSAFDEESVDLLEELNVPAFKIASGEITNVPLLKHVAKKMKPIILSTGMATLGEIEEALETIRQQGINDVILLHCVTNYPVQTEDLNLRVIQTLSHAFNVPVGFSDHSLGITAPIAAVALGACMIEKHFTLNKDLPGPDHKASLEPAEFGEMVKAIRDAEKALGDGVKRLTNDEVQIRKVVRKSLVARTMISKGEKITRDKIAVKRPSGGIEPKYFDTVIGRAAKKQIEEDEILQWEDID